MNLLGKPDKLLEPEAMLELYGLGAFPMTDIKGVINWYYPETRTIIPVEAYNCPRSLRKFMERCPFEYRYDSDQIRVIKCCAEREPTWISERLIEAYRGLLRIGHLHSVEVYADDNLVGGLYGVTYRGAFFGESMFSRAEQASKAALVKLLGRLNEGGFGLLDVQYMTEHLRMFGAREISLAQYKKLLMDTRDLDPVF